MPAESDTRRLLALRAGLVKRVRAFFDERGVLEVDTPALSAAAPTDVHIHSLVTEVSGLGHRWLHTSPEFPMKRLLAAGSGDIWQLCRVFRDGERGSMHEPEFQLLEWYRLGYDEHRLAAEVVELLSRLLEDTREVGPALTMTCDEAIARVTGRAGYDAEEFDRIMALEVGPALGHEGPCIVTEWPLEHAALARIRDGKAVRFEVYLDGVELANGYHELTDATEQRARFDGDNVRRATLGLPVMPVDESLLDALASGMPDCAGVALGLDRVVMLAAGASHIGDILPMYDG